MAGISIPEYAGPFVLTVDIGTSSARARLFDANGSHVKGIESHVPYRMETTASGGVEISADKLIGIAAAAIDEALAVAVRLSTHPGAAEFTDIGTVSICTFWHALMGVDRDGSPITPVYSWNDTRAAGAARELRRDLDERAQHARTGCVFHASYWPAKLTWLRSVAPDHAARVVRWISPGEYLHLRLLGRAFCSISMASATGIFNQNKCDWDYETLGHLALSPDNLSPLGDVDSSLEGLNRPYADRWPQLAGALWLPVLGDGACSNIGSGCLTRRRAALMVGTSGAMRVLWEANKVTIPWGLWCYRADRRRFVMGGALSNGGDLYEWLRGVLRVGTEQEIEAELAAMEADSHGLTVLPFLSGERSTGWVAEARAAMTGMSLDTTPLEIMRAGLEAVAYRFAAINDLIVKGIEEPETVVGSGAALLRSPAWAQIISDALGKPVIVAGETEASSKGAALLALEALGTIERLEEEHDVPGKVYGPNLRRHRIYAAARQRQEDVYDALIKTANAAI